MQGKTSPPDYLSESDLISLMEKHGIGTDASIAVHINNICERNYVSIQAGRKVVPTELGITLVRGYQKIDPELCSPQVRCTACNVPHELTASLPCMHERLTSRFTYMSSMHCVLRFAEVYNHAIVDEPVNESHAAATHRHAPAEPDFKGTHSAFCSGKSGIDLPYLARASVRMWLAEKHCSSICKPRNRLCQHIYYPNHFSVLLQLCRNTALFWLHAPSEECGGLSPMFKTGLIQRCPLPVQVRGHVEAQISLIAAGKAEKGAVVLHTLAQFAHKFRFFVSHIARMDDLFQASFSPLSSSGKQHWIEFASGSEVGSASCQWPLNCVWYWLGATFVLSVNLPGLTLASMPEAELWF